MMFSPSEISAPSGGHLPRHRPPWERQCHAEQHACLRFFMPQLDGCGGFCGSQICQQAGLPFPGLRHYLNCLYLCWSIKILDPSTRISVSLTKVNTCLRRMCDRIDCHKIVNVIYLLLSVVMMFQIYFNSNLSPFCFVFSSMVTVLSPICNQLLSHRGKHMFLHSMKINGNMWNQRRTL